MTPLRGMLSDAFEDERIKSDPLHGWTPKKREPHSEEDAIDPFEPSEIHAMLEFMPTQVANMVTFGFWTGLRTSELIALEWNDIDLEQESVFVQRARVADEIKAPKTRSGRREVKLFPPAFTALEQQRPFTFLAGKEVFHNPRTNGH